MKYTIKTFIKALIGSKKELEFLEETKSSPPLSLIWDGGEIRIVDSEDEVLDRFPFTRNKVNLFSLDLWAHNYWYLNVEFSDGGPRLNKEYTLRDYI